MASLNQGDASKVSSRRTLRAVNSVAGLCGLVLNTIILAIERAGSHGNSITEVTCLAYIPIVLSIWWNHFDIHALRLEPTGVNVVSIVVDAGLSLGFLAITIINGIVVSDLDFIEKWWRVLLTYNSMPWIICDVLHLFVALQVIKEMVGFNPTWRLRSTCSNCQRKLSSTTGGRGDSAKYRLLGDEVYDDDLENNRSQVTDQAKGPIHLADDA